MATIKIPIPNLGFEYPVDFARNSQRILSGKYCRLMDDGTLFNNFGPRLGWQRYPMTQAIFLLGLTQMWSRTEDRDLLEVMKRTGNSLVHAGVTGPSGTIGFPSRLAKLGYNLPKVWYSALTQSFCASALLRLGIITDEETWSLHARGAIKFMTRSSDLVTKYPSGGCWFHEYPTVPPTPVLNGHMYALIGLHDLGTKLPDSECITYFQGGISGLVSNIERFDAAGLSYYDSRRHILAKAYYQKLHVRQLKLLAELSGETRLAEVADRWEEGFERKWGVGALLRYAAGTLLNGFQVEGGRFPISYLSYALGDPGLSIITRITNQVARR